MTGAVVYCLGGKAAVKKFAIAGMLVVIPASFAHAQAGRPVESVVVTGERGTAAVIDRKIYSVSTDIKAATGSVDDVLRDLPSVDVDVSGNVSLRGDSGVEVLIDGKPSTQMSPANRGTALQQMPANTIESIEVITNPSAEFKPDGPAGIINIITKKTHAAGLTGTLQGGFGSEGRYSLGATGAYNDGALNLTGAVSLRHETRKRISIDERVRIDPAGNTNSNQQTLFVQERTTATASAGFDYDFDPKNRLSGSLLYSRRADQPQSAEHDTANDTKGVLIGDYDRLLASGKGTQVSTQASTGYRRNFDDKGQFTFDLRRGETQDDQRNTYNYVYRIPLSPGTTSEQILSANQTKSELTAEYSLPMAGKAKLKAGYDLEHDGTDDNDYGGTIVAATHIPDPAQTNHFLYDQTIHAAYGTYEFLLGDWDFVAGLRLEDTLINTNQITSAIKNSRSYTAAYPSFHLEYPLGKDQTFRLSYSHRVARPDPLFLNPYIVVQSAYSVRAGNPDLKPAQTHSLEAGYDVKAFGANLSATLYYRQSYDSLTNVSSYISPTLVLTTFQNLGKSLAAGLEFAANGKLSADLAYNLSGNLYYNEVNAAALGVPARSLDSYMLKASFDYTIGPQDMAQISTGYNNKRLFAQQGYRFSSGNVNLGYRHKITDALAVVVTVADLFVSQHDGGLTSTPTLLDRNTQHPVGRTTILGLTWNFGGKPARDSGFDYSG